MVADMLAVEAAGRLDAVVEALERSLGVAVVGRIERTLVAGVVVGRIVAVEVGHSSGRQA